MKYTKRILAALLCVTLLLGTAACSKGSRKDSIEEGIRDAARDASDGKFDLNPVD